MVDVVKDGDFDITEMTETWLAVGTSDQIIVGDVAPARYRFHHRARTHRKGGGVGILIRDSLNFQNHFCFQAKSFENYQLTLTSWNKVFMQLQSSQILLIPLPPTVVICSS